MWWGSIHKYRAVRWTGIRSWCWWIDKERVGSWVPWLISIVLRISVNCSAFWGMGKVRRQVWGPAGAWSSCRVLQCLKASLPLTTAPLRLVGPDSTWCLSSFLFVTAHLRSTWVLNLPSKAVSPFLCTVWQLLSRGRWSALTWSDTLSAAGAVWREKPRCFGYLCLYPACLCTNNYRNKCLLILKQKAVSPCYEGKKRKERDENPERACLMRLRNGLLGADSGFWCAVPPESESAGSRGRSAVPPWCLQGAESRGCAWVSSGQTDVEPDACLMRHAWMERDVKRRLTLLVFFSPFDSCSRFSGLMLMPRVFLVQPDTGTVEHLSRPFSSCAKCSGWFQRCQLCQAQVASHREWS